MFALPVFYRGFNIASSSQLYDASSTCASTRPSDCITILYSREISVHWCSKQRVGGSNRQTASLLLDFVCLCTATCYDEQRRITGDEIETSFFLRPSARLLLLPNALSSIEASPFSFKAVCLANPSPLEGEGVGMLFPIKF